VLFRFSQCDSCPCPLCDLDRLRAELEQVKELHYLQLAAISVATLQNTEDSKKERIAFDNPYWTVAYGDVCVAIDREIAERVARVYAEQQLMNAPCVVSEHETLRDELEKIISTRQSCKNSHVYYANSHEYPCPWCELSLQERDNDALKDENKQLYQELSNERTALELACEFITHPMSLRFHPEPNYFRNKAREE